MDILFLFSHQNLSLTFLKKHSLYNTKKKRKKFSKPLKKLKKVKGEKYQSYFTNSNPMICLGG